MIKYVDETLLEYQKSDIYPFHMPGHKRRVLGEWYPEQIDITEIDGFDNLHHAEGILKEGQERLAQLCGADESFYLVNGSTGGLLAAICGCVRKGDRILIGRNCHKAVYHAVYLMELRAEYVYPEAADFGIQGSVSPDKIREKLDLFPDIAAVVITSPTYDGVVSDIASIAKIVHEREIPLIVDEAHGAHFGFSGGFPEKAIQLGADFCIESFHKTLPSFTQTAVLHMKNPQGCLWRTNRVKRYLGIFQSSSPSYIFMAGIDRCVRILRENMLVYADPDTRDKSLFVQFEHRLEQFYADCGKLQRIEVYPWFRTGCHADNRVWDRDNSKILISAQRAGLTGQKLYDLLLKNYHLQMEMASGHYVTALTSLMDSEEGFRRLKQALLEIDREYALPGKFIFAGSRRQSAKDCAAVMDLYRAGKKVLELAEAMESKTQECLLPQAAGFVSAEFIYLYPPGIPVIAPGEVLTAEIIYLICQCQKQGLQVQGMQDLTGKKVRVVSGK